MSVVLFGQIFQKAISLFSVFFLARLLGEEGYGMYATIMAMMLAVSTLVNMGLPEGSIRFFSVLYDERKFSNLISIYLTSLLILSSSFLLFYIFWFFTSTIITEFFSSASEFENGVFWIILSVPFWGFVSISATYVQCLGRLLYQQFLLSIRGVLFVAFLILFVGNEDLLSKVCFLFFLSNFLSALVGAAICLFISPIKQILCSAIKKNTVSQLVSSSVLVMLGNISWVIWSSIDRFMLAKISTFEQVAVYNFAFSISINITIAVTAIGYIITPLIAVFYRQGKLGEIQRIYRWYTAISVSMTSFLFMLIFINIDPIFILAKFDAEDGGDTLLVLLISQWIVSVVGPVGRVFIGCGRERHALYSALLQAGVNIALNFILIPYWGALGAAYATLITMIISRIYMVYVLRKHLKVSISLIPNIWFGVMAAAGSLLYEILMTEDGVLLLGFDVVANTVACAFFLLVSIKVLCNYYHELFLIKSDDGAFKWAVSMLRKNPK